MVSRQEIKKGAKLSLHGHWGMAAAIAALNIYCVPLLIYSADNLSNLFRRYQAAVIYLGWAAQFILLACFCLGNACLFLAVVSGRDADTDTFFSAFDNILRTMVLYFLILLFISLWSLLLVFPGIIAAYRYRMAFYILAESPELSPLDAIRISKNMTSGKKWSIFIFDLSFAGWFILSAITGGIAGIYAFPYYSTSMAALYRELKVEYVDRRTSQLNNENNFN